jgi:DNA repair protein RecO (recombination protein O)
MHGFSTPAVLLRRIDFGDYDVIVTLFSRRQGKISAIAKSAKRSTKRFSGILELFSVLDVVCSSGRGKGLPVLQEAVLIHPFSKIRADILKTASASYWAEMMNEWTEAGVKLIEHYDLLIHVLTALNADEAPAGALNILFQMRFLTLSGYAPDLSGCSNCRVPLEKIQEASIRFDLKRGGLLCSRCASGAQAKLSLHKGTIKQLQWIKRRELKTADRLRLTPQAITEGQNLLEAFGPYHLGKVPKSLSFLQQIRY